MTQDLAQNVTHVTTSSSKAIPQTRGNARHTAIDWLVGVILLLAFVWVLPRWADPNQNSRLDMVFAVVDDGTFRIDEYVSNTVDYAKVDGHYYSDKAPGLALLGIPLYAAARPLLDSPALQELTDRLDSSPAFAATLRAEGSGVLADKVRFALVQVMLSALLAALPTALTGVLVWRLALRVSGHELAALAAALGYGLATPAFAYANAFYGHQLTAFLLVAAFALVYLARETPGPARLIVIGVLLAYAFISEYPAFLPAGILFLYTAWRLVQQRVAPRLLWMILAGLVVGGGWMLYNMTVFGGPLTLGYGHSELWTEQHSTGFMSLSWPTWDATLGITISPYRGLFVLAPWLLLALPGFMLWARKHGMRAEWWTTLGCVLTMFLFNMSSHMWWGGFAVGPRYLLPALPFLALGAAPALAALFRSRLGQIVAALLLVVSTALTWAMSLAGQAYPADTIYNPWIAVVGPAWRGGDIARNLGTLLGLRGASSLAPLLLLLVLGGATSVLLLRRRTPESTPHLTLTTEEPHLHA